MDRPVVAFEVVTAPASEPVTLAEAKLQCRVTSTDEDDLLTSLIQVARELVEIHTERALITQTRRIWLDRFPMECGQFLEIPFRPIASISSVMYRDTAGDWQTWSTDDYVTDLVSAPARIQPVYGGMYPVTQWQMNSVKVQFVCGAASGSVPAAAKHAMKLLIGHWYENREAIGKVGGEIDLSYWSLVNALKWH